MIARSILVGASLLAASAILARAIARGEAEKAVARFDEEMGKAMDEAAAASKTRWAALVGDRPATLVVPNEAVPQRQPRSAPDGGPHVA